MKESVPWHIIAGFGGHIKATSTTLVIRKKGVEEELPLSSVNHLLVVGGHNLHTSAVTHLLRNGSSISFFDPDGTPLSIMRPYGSYPDEELRSRQMKSPGYKSACEIVKSSIMSRILMIEEASAEMGRSIYYQGEDELLSKMLEDIEYLIKMDELRRIHRLSSDMYYEIISRSINPAHGFRRRTERPHNDPVNSMLSLGYAMLFGNCSVSVVGAHLDTDIGILSTGKRSLVQDLIDPLKARMVDSVVFSVAREYLTSDHYESGTKRCHLDDDIIKVLTNGIRNSIDQNIIEKNVSFYYDSIVSGSSLNISY